MVVAPAEVQIPPIEGGPVYHTSIHRPIFVGDTAERLQELCGLPLVVLFVCPNVNAELLNDYADLLPPDVGGFVLVPSAMDVPLHQVTCTPAAAGWQLRARETTITLRPGPQGFVVHSTASPAPPTTTASPAPTSGA